jgi:outer membrane protein assembly complex protein YaeT
MVGRGWRRSARVLQAALCILYSPLDSRAQIGEPVVDIVIEQEGRPADDSVLAALIETRVGAPLSMADVRETVSHVMSLNRFDDVRVFSETIRGGLRLRYVLTPLHPIDRIEFQGLLGLPEDELRRLIVDRFSASPGAGRTVEMSETLRGEYRRRGYVAARVEPRIVETHDPDRATLVFDIQSGDRTTITDVLVIQVDADQKSTLVERPDVRAGQPLDEVAIDRQLRAWEDRLRARGYYEVRASHGVQIADNEAFVTVNLTRGPRVAVAFAGDPIPEVDRERLAPIRAEGSADEDLLEDSSRAIELYLNGLGHRDAEVTYSRDERDDELVITFRVDRGPQYVVRDIVFAGQEGVPESELRSLVSLDAGGPFVRAALAEGVVAVERLYRSRGYAGVIVKAGEDTLPAGRSDESVREVTVRLEIAPGPRTLVRLVSFEGGAAFDTPTLQGLIVTAPGRPMSEADIVADRDRLDLAYRDRGYASVSVAPVVTFDEGDTQADVAFRINEGPQVIVDHVIVVGNRRISSAIIQRELLLREGEPLGYSALIESRARLAALGLFRRIQIDQLAHGGADRRDVIVEVEEADPTVLGFGGGVEGGFRLRPTGAGGVAEERFELAPRGFFEIGRRNLWGKNRSVNLFTRVSLRTRDSAAAQPNGPLPDSTYGFNEYRVVGQFREPRTLTTTADVVVTGIVEQAIRSSFNFSRREARAQAGFRLSRQYSLAALYSFQRTRLFDERFTPQEQPLIDRLFPEIRLSKLSGSFIRDSRDDVLDASRGMLVIVDADLAARAIGSEVGFVKTYIQSFYYHRLPSARRMVLALGARLGAAHGLPREAGGEVVQDLPASERFFAGGDTSVRGFTLDRLGNERTITPTGFPTGGNGVVVLNSELRVGVVGDLQAVGFVDAGNVFPRASDLDLTDLRAAAGFGVLYRSPIGPVRVDLGFNLDPRELVPGIPERRRVLHVLLGQAF